MKQALFWVLEFIQTCYMVSGTLGGGLDRYDGSCLSDEDSEASEGEVVLLSTLPCEQQIRH